MQKCFYHGKTTAKTVCVGCKMPVCQTCSDEGKKGYCHTCCKKVASVAAQVTDVRKTTYVAPPEGVPATGRGPACFQHPELQAGTTCLGCSRPYCPACLNSQGLCQRCVEPGSAPPPPRQARRARKSMPEAGFEPEAPIGPDRKKQLIAGLAGVVVVVGGFALLKRPAPQTPSASALYHSTPLTPQEKAMMAKLERDAKHAVSLGDAPAQAPVAYADEPVRRGRAAAPTYARSGAAAPAAPVYRAPAPVRLRVGVASPRSGAVVSGIAPVTAIASGADKVELLVDGEWCGTADSPPYTFDWASHGVGNGRHRLTVVATTADGRQSSSSVVVTVRN
jgi:hypothetical protein